MLKNDVIISETHLNSLIPDSVVSIDGYNIFRRDRDWAGTDKRKKGGVAMYVRDNLKVLDIWRDMLFEMLGVQLLLPSGHWMLVIDAILEHCNMFLDTYSYGVILCRGDVNKLNLDQLSMLSGLAALVDFPTRGNSILDNCLTNKRELYDQPFLFQALQ